jgi:hypothetical protein
MTVKDSESTEDTMNTMMTVAELIQALQQQPPDRLVRFVRASRDWVHPGTVNCLGTVEFSTAGVYRGELWLLFRERSGSGAVNSEEESDG